MDFTDKFKADFRYYKRKCPPPEYSQVLDFSNLPEESSVKTLVPSDDSSQLVHLSAAESFIADLMEPPSKWNIYEVVDKPGLIFIRNPFKMIGQRYWIYRCLKDYTCQPNRLNIDAHNILDKSESWWDACHSYDQHHHSLLKKLRWATIGYHHDWNSKVYSENMKDPFPSDLAALSRYVNRIVGHKDDFNAEAAIINFYHFDSTLSGHTDHSEIDMSAPLFSFSFGQTAIFLIGGTSLDIAPIALFIKSGDIVIMSKDSRQCYHAIPRILPANESLWSDSSVRTSTMLKNENLGRGVGGDISSAPLKNSLCASNDQDLLRNLLDDRVWKPFEEYVAESRINMNVRQVLPKGETLLHNDIN